jgi:predicted DNA-binding protein
MSENKTKLKIMSLSIEPDMQDLLKASAKKAGCSVSHLIRDLVEKHLSLLVNDGEEIHVIIDVPAHLKGDEGELRQFLNSKIEAIVKALCVEE